MGRLIDADKLLNAFGLSEKTRKYGGDHSGYDTRMLYEIQDTIEDATEVDAIPVEWIELHISALEFIGKKESVRRAEAIRNMLGIWRYEQKGN